MLPAPAPVATARYFQDPPALPLVARRVRARPQDPRDRLLVEIKREHLVDVRVPRVDAKAVLGLARGALVGGLRDSK